MLCVCFSEIYYESRRSPYIEIFSLKTEWIDLPRQSSLTTVACYKSCSNTEPSVRFSEKLLQVPQWKSGALRCAKSYRRSVCYVKNETLTSSLSGSFVSRLYSKVFGCFALRSFPMTVVFTFLHSIATSRCRKNDSYVART